MPATKRDEMKLLRELFAANGYPRTFIERNRMPPRTRNEERFQPKSWRSILYRKGISETVARSLSPVGKGVSHRPTSTIRQHVMRPKDPIPNRKKSAVVYRLQCSSGICNYVRETGPQLQTRMQEHQLAVLRLDPKLELATHAVQMGHVFNFEIVGRGDDHTSRRTKEAWTSTDCSVNRQINLPAPYLVLRAFLSGDPYGMEHPGHQLPPWPTLARIDHATVKHRLMRHHKGSASVTTTGVNQAVVGRHGRNRLTWQNRRSAGMTTPDTAHSQCCQARSNANSNI
ncbi:unnamed protein product [Schistocephalus solidus]|uniref:Uncharacterized protein n=1 Tax=Schistocephalus solidus TaxID=70667 RepID=A0A183SSV5_SCHSO|nr:unnamed protein product [Schistocephalus solidus]